MADPLSQELSSVLVSLKSGKASGETGILPQMLKADCKKEGFMKLFLELMGDVWMEQKMPYGWCNAVLIPILKKGNLIKCDNCRGIALQDVVGKGVVRVM